MNSDALVDCIQKSICDISASIKQELKSSPSSPASVPVPPVDENTETDGSSSRPKEAKSDIDRSTCVGGSSGSDAPAEIVRVDSTTARKSTEIADEFVCPICHGLLFRPIRPECSHRYCRFCLILWADKCTKSAQLSACPLCREAIVYPETLPVDTEMEQRIISEMGLDVYQSRHRDMVKEKVERLMVDLELEHRLEVEESYATTLHFGARAGILGTAFGGPVGAVAALGVMGAYAVYTQLKRLKREDRRKYGLIEDDASAWLDMPPRSMQVTNLTLTKVIVELFDQEGVFPLETRAFEPQESAYFRPTESTTYTVSDNVAYYLRVILPGIVDKDLAGIPAALDHGYLFCCTDVCVEEVALIERGRYPSRAGVIEMRNESPVTVKCTIYTSSYFADETVTIEPNATELTILPRGILKATVLVSVVNESFFIPDTELCSVQMRAKYVYRILESRILNEDLRKQDDAVFSGVEEGPYF